MYILFCPLSLLSLNLKKNILAIILMVPFLCQFKAEISLTSQQLYPLLALILFSILLVKFILIGHLHAFYKAF
jgi:hypothetical protein